jgi:hypothetical protein
MPRYVAMKHYMEHFYQPSSKQQYILRKLDDHFYVRTLIDSRGAEPSSL